MGFVLSFFRDQRGAVTIDWVALTAGILLLGMIVVFSIFKVGLADLSQGVNASLSEDIERPVLTSPTQSDYQ